MEIHVGGHTVMSKILLNFMINNETFRNNEMI